MLERPLDLKSLQNSQTTYYSFSGSKCQPREIHIWEFPHDFRVLLEPLIMERLVDRVSKKVGNYSQLAKVLSISSSAIHFYRTSHSSIPLALLLRLCDLAGEEFPIEQIEPNIIAYKGGPSSKPIQNPKLPLVETPALFAIMGHLTGDGGYNIREAYNNNTHEVLIDKFLQLFHDVFGKVPVHVAVRRKKTNKQDLFDLRFDINLIRLLKHLYHVDFRTYTARIPQRLFILPREYAAAYLRAFGDDEGNVEDVQIRLVSVNKQLMYDIYSLIQAKFPELGVYTVFKQRKQKSNPTWADTYHIRFRTEAFANYRALIGFTHPEKKQELDHNLNRHARGWKQRNPGITRRKILEVLSSTTSMTAKTLAKWLKVTVVAVRQSHLKCLITLGVVRIQEGTGSYGAKLFELTEWGRKFFKLPEIGLLSGRTGRSKVKILQILKQVDGMTVSGLVRQIKLPKQEIERQLNGNRRHGICKPGLRVLGLVERSGRGGKPDPYVYSLTSKGRWFLDELEISLPTLSDSV